MNDDQTPVQPAQPDPASQPIVDDLVAQGTSIQDLFAQNDANLAQDDSQQPADPQATDPASQKSPLDILEEILSKEEKKDAPQVPVDAGPTPEELERIRQLEEQEKMLIEQQRQKMQAEVSSDEQKQRDQIRVQSAAANQVTNPYEIKQIERKKVVR